MRVLKKLVIALAVLVLAAAVTILVAGALTPEERSFTNDVEIDAPAETIWQVITDKRRYTEWQTQLERVEILDAENWIEYPRSAPAPVRFRVISDSRPDGMELEYTMGDYMLGRWKGEMTPAGNGVRLKTVDSYKTEGLAMRILMIAFFDLDRFAKDWNNKLKARSEALAR